MIQVKAARPVEPSYSVTIPLNNLTLVHEFFGLLEGCVDTLGTGLAVTWHYGIPTAY
jgi:hypothetical protein